MNEQEKNRWKEEEIEKFLKTTNWRRANDGKGRTYYYVKGAKTTQWNKPDELKEFEKSLDEKLAAIEAGGNLKEGPVEMEVDSTKTEQVHSQPTNNESNTLPTKSSTTTDEQVSNPAETTVKADITASVSQPGGAIKVPVKVTMNKVGPKPTQSKNPFAQASYESDDEEEEIPANSSAYGGSKPATSSIGEESKQYAFSPVKKEGEEPETSISEEVKKVEEGDPILLARDAITNPTAVEYAINKIKEDPNSKGEVLNSLVSHYVGYAQLSNILVEWITYADHLNKSRGLTNATDSSVYSFGSTEGSIQALQEKKFKEILCQLLVSRFTRKTADDNSKLTEALKGIDGEEGKWLKGLFEDEIVSRTIEELHHKYPESSFLRSSVEHIRQYAATKADSSSAAVPMEI